MSRSSLVLRKALSNAGTHGEPATKTVQLRNIEPDTFAVYLHWLYFSTIPVKTDQVDVEDLEIAKAYVLGYRLGDATYQNAVVDAIVEKLTYSMPAQDECFSAEAVRYIYDHMPESTKNIRRLLVDVYTERRNSRWLQKCPFKERLPHSFLLDLSAGLMDWPSRMPRSIRAPYYYVITTVCDNEDKEKDNE